MILTAFSGCVVKDEPLIGYSTDYVQTMFVSLESWHPWGFCAVVTDAGDNEAFAVGASVDVHFEDGTTVKFSDGSEEVYSYNGISEKCRGISVGSELEIQFHGWVPEENYDGPNLVDATVIIQGE